MIVQKPREETVSLIGPSEDAVKEENSMRIWKKIGHRTLSLGPKLESFQAAREFETISR